ncbi:MAG: alpha-L-rhamnosidase C-terminal domain-containing protein [Fimbriimonadales bacterium]
MPGKWIWNDAEKRREWNQWVGFRRSFSLDSVPESATLMITADAEYRVWINGEWVGQGPARGWPDEWWYDEYEIAHLLKPGENLIAILGHSIGVSTFKYILSDAGVRAGIVSRETILVETDESWECASRVFPHFATKKIKACCQLGWLEPAMTGPGFPSPFFLHGPAEADADRAVQVSDSRAIARGLARAEVVRTLTGALVQSQNASPPCTAIAISLREALLPGYLQASPAHISGILLISFHAAEQCQVRIEFGKNWFHVQPGVRLNGQEMKEAGAHHSSFECGKAYVGDCAEGRNTLWLRTEGYFHDWTTSFTLEPAACRIDLDYLVVGPLETGELERIWSSGDEVLALSQERLTRCNLLMPSAHVKWPFAKTAYAAPSPEGSRMQATFDFGSMTVGYWEVECETSAEVGTLHLNGFESFQEGEPDFAWEMANTMEIAVPRGRHSFGSMLRRGGRFVLAQSADVTVTAVRCHESTYPSKLAAEFECSDDRLNKIFDMCALTLRLCSEDTFVDCPTYEQTYWVGDSRVECLTNYTLYGDYELCKRCLRLAAGSLRRSEMVESHVPSGWPIVIPAWSALWAMACADTMDFIGDEQFLSDVHPALVKQLDAFENHIDARGLFSIDAWNLTDWSGMDQPDRGVTTANQAWINLATKATKRVCERFGDLQNSARCDAIVSRLMTGTNEHLWKSDRDAFVDCVDPDTGELSAKLSIQTQCLMALSGIAEGERLERCHRLVSGTDASDGFVQVGTPYFMFFVFELLDRMGKYQQIVNLSREKWGIMLDAGSTTCWEVFPGYMPGGRNTRSYCHAWSTAPAHFLIRNQLGIRPLSPTKYLFDPKPGGLTFCRGAHPTPFGPIFVEWEIVDGKMKHRIEKPDKVEVVVK